MFLFFSFTSAYIHSFAGHGISHFSMVHNQFGIRIRGFSNAILVGLGLQYLKGINSSTSSPAFVARRHEKSVHAVVPQHIHYRSRTPAA